MKMNGFQVKKCPYIKTKKKLVFKCCQCNLFFPPSYTTNKNSMCTHTHKILFKYISTDIAL